MTPDAELNYWLHLTRRSPGWQFRRPAFHAIDLPRRSGGTCRVYLVTASTWGHYRELGRPWHREQARRPRPPVFRPPGGLAA